MCQQAVGDLDGTLASLYSDIHRLASLTDQPCCARDRDDFLARNEHDIYSARKQRFIDGEPCKQVLRLEQGPQLGRTVDAGAAQLVTPTSPQAFDLYDERRRTIRKFAAAKRETGHLGNSSRVPDQGKAGD